MLGACSTEGLRARAALEFLRAHAGAEGGYIYLATAENRLRLAAGTHGSQPPPGLADEADQTWRQELDTRNEIDATLDLEDVESLGRKQRSPYWIDDSGERYYRFLLHTHYRGDWIPLGVVALRWGQDETLPVIGRRHLDAICVALIEAGDVSKVAFVD